MPNSSSIHNATAVEVEIREANPEERNICEDENGRLLNEDLFALSQTTWNDNDLLNSSGKPRLSMKSNTTTKKRQSMKSTKNGFKGDDDSLAFSAS